MISKATHPTQCIFGLTPDRQSPNKTPEPTTFAVTSRAIVPFYRKQSTDRSTYCCTSRASEGRGSSDALGKNYMQRLNLSPVVLSAASSAAIMISFAFARIASPATAFSRSLTSQWIELFAIEAASAIPLFFLSKNVRGSRWLWLVWLVSAANYSVSELRVVWHSYHSWLVSGVYFAWAVKVVVLLMLFSPRKHGGETDLPDKVPARTPTAVTPHATEDNIESDPRNLDRCAACGAPAVVVTHFDAGPKCASNT